MPIYEYICKSCSEQFDKLTSYDWKAAGVSCPNCNSKDLDRIVSRIGGFTSGGKLQTLDSGSCSSCSSTGCSTCSTPH